MKLLGHVDRANKFLIAGWALCEEDPRHRPELHIIQRGQVVHSLRPLFEAHQLRDVLNLPRADCPPIYDWRLWMPLANGIEPDLEFSIIFAENEKALTLGVDRKIVRFEHCDESALHDFDTSTFVFPSFTQTESGIQFWIKVEQPEKSAPSILQVGEDTKIAHSETIGIRNKRISNYSFEVASADLGKQRDFNLKISLVNSMLDRDRISLYELHIPKTLFDEGARIAPLPDPANIHRVSGPLSNEAQYLVGGLTTFFQLNTLLETHFAKSITQFPTVVDWGVGCARVARHFWESASACGLPTGTAQNIIGLDIDEVNIGWCRANLNNCGSYDLLSLDGFSLPSASVDFLYGISVFTHLSEYHQHKWLSEFRRILRPGGAAIVTIHGEGVYYREAASLMLPFVEKFGFFDGIADSAIGKEREGYYRASYHSRWYVREEWSKYFDILEIIPMANAFRQDYVVLRRS